MKLIIGKYNNFWQKKYSNRGKFRLKYKEQHLHAYMIANVNHDKRHDNTNKNRENYEIFIKNCQNNRFNIKVQSMFHTTLVLMSMGCSCIIVLTTFPRQNIQIS